MKKINTITIIGANSNMGSNIAAIFASFGDAKVYMISRTIEKSINAINKACLSIRASAIKDNMIPKTYDHLKECLNDSDLILESVVEDIEVKKKINFLIEKELKKDALIVTSTSGLSVEEMGSILSTSNRKNYYGFHFFNPPYNMLLCELIITKHNNLKKTKEIKIYLEKKLKRKVVITKDSPGFLANRIGFQLINYCLILANEHQDEGGIDYLDNIIGPFTGRTMAPLVTADFVGLDVHAAIVNNIYNKTNDLFHETFLLPLYIEQLINEKRLGFKTSTGLYGPNKTVYDLKTKKYRKIVTYNFNFKNKIIEFLRDGNYYEAINYLYDDTSKEGLICQKVLTMYAIYAIIISGEISTNIDDADIAMTSGFNWAPPSSIVSILGEKKFLEKVHYFFPNIIISKNINDIICKIDYRPYYKAR